MTAAQRQLVADAVATYRRIRADLARAVPFWPLGLPGWTDTWLALGMRTPDVTYLVVWRRPPISGGDAAVPAELAVPVPYLSGRPATARVSYPDNTATVAWHGGRGELAVTLPRLPSACLVELRAGISNTAELS
ncbi:MAG TPA: hypothetical protein VGL06_26920 [Pseudonocardiaceae bacterium]